MDHLVDQTVLILTNEPADIYANPTFLPDTMANDYDKYWTDGRIERVLDVLQQPGILRRSHQAMRPHSRRYMVPVDEHTPLPPHCHIQPIRVAGNNRCHLHQQKRYTYGHSSHHLGHPLSDCRIGRLHPAYDSGTARSLCRLVASTFHGQGAVFHHAVTSMAGSSRPCTDTGLFRPDAGQQI